MNQWINELHKNQSISASMTDMMIQWSNESMKRWFSESVNQCMSELVSRWVSESMNERMHGWITEWPLRRGTSSLSYFFLEQRLQREANFWPRLSSRYSLVRFFVDIEARKRGNPTAATPGAKLSEKRHRFSCPRGFSPVSAHASEPYTSQLLDDGWWCSWHGDVVDMMVWMLPMTIVHNSEVF